MPKAYEDIRDKLLAKGESKAEAEGTAARIYNGKIRKAGEPPVTRNYEKTARKYRKGIVAKAMKLRP